jgi:hypothetical protein
LSFADIIAYFATLTLLARTEQFKRVGLTPKLTAIKDFLKSSPNCEFVSLSKIQEYGDGKGLSTSDRQG